MRLQLFVMLFSPAAWAGYTKLQYIGKSFRVLFSPGRAGDT